MTGLTNKEDDGTNIVIVSVAIPERELPNFLAAVELVGINTNFSPSVKALADFWSDEMGRK